MTGTGTQTDPYIISSYGELEELAGTATADMYIEFDADAPNKIINMNELYPYGAPTLDLSRCHLNGNGWIIRSLYTTDTWISTTTNCEIQGLTVESFKHDSANPFIKFDYGNASPTFILKKNIFRGYIKSSSMIYGGRGYWGNVFGTIISNSINIDYQGTADFKLFDCSAVTEFSHNQIKILSTVGDIAWILYQEGGRGGYLNPQRATENLIEINGERTNTVQVFTEQGASTPSFVESQMVFGDHKGDISVSGTGVSVYDSDTLTGVSGTELFKGCTHAQLHNAEYLHSIGFTIGVN